MLAKKIKQVEQEINQYNNLTRQELYQQCIDAKLKVTLDNYLHIIEVNEDYLLTRNSVKVMKAITKQQKKEDKERLAEESM